MQFVVASSSGFYQNVNRKPSWVGSLAEAKVFATERQAKTIVAILRLNNLRAVVIKVPSVPPMRK